MADDPAGRHLAKPESSHDSDSETDAVQPEQLKRLIDQAPAESISIIAESLLEGTAGDFPPPGMLGRYSEVVHDGAERLFTEAIAEGHARRELDRRSFDLHEYRIKQELYF